MKLTFKKKWEESHESVGEDGLGGGREGVALNRCFKIPVTVTLLQ